jgi:hypothetical protein
VTLPLLKNLPAHFAFLQRGYASCFFAHEPSHHHLFPLSSLTVLARRTLCQRKRLVPLSPSAPLASSPPSFFRRHEEKPGVRDRAHPSANVFTWISHQSPVLLRIWGCCHWIDRRRTGFQGAHSSSEDVRRCWEVLKAQTPRLFGVTLQDLWPRILLASKYSNRFVAIFTPAR